MLADALKPRRYQLAAGGVLERSGAQGIEIAVVHRKRYEHTDGKAGDYVLPKGKVAPGEDLEATALREVREETGCEARIAGPVFESEYLAAGVPKLVAFFQMALVAEHPIEDDSEVSEVLWLSPSDASRRLTYESERAVLERMYPGLTRTGEQV